MKTLKEGVALKLGEDRGGGNGARDGIAVDEILLRKRRIDLDGVDEEEVGLWVEGLDRAEHGEAAGLEYVDCFDLGDAGIADGPRDGFGLEAGGETGTLGGRNDLGIAETADFAIFRKNDCGGCDGPK